MKKEYDFTKAKRGPIVAAAQGKTRVTIRLDNDILDSFRKLVDRLRWRQLPDPNQ